MHGNLEFRDFAGDMQAFDELQLPLTPQIPKRAWGGIAQCPEVFGDARIFEPP
jgi:hypothetical protein